LIYNFIVFQCLETVLSKGGKYITSQSCKIYTDRQGSYLLLLHVCCLDWQSVVQLRIIQRLW